MAETHHERLKLPEGAIVTAEVHVAGYLDPEGDGTLKTVVFCEADVPLSSALGLLEIAKLDLIERTER